MNEFGVDTLDEVSQSIVDTTEFGIFRQGWFGYSDMCTPAYLTRTTWYNTDPYWTQNVRIYQNSNKPGSVYFFSHAWNAASAVHEADVCIQKCVDSNITPDWPVFLDWESAGPGSGGSYEALVAHGITLTNALFTEIITAWCQRINQLGYRAGWYTNQWIASSILGTSTIDSLRNNAWYYWNAEWNSGATNPWYSCDIWQKIADTPYLGVNIDWNYVRDDRIWNGGGHSNIPIWLMLKMAGEKKNGKCTILL